MEATWPSADVTISWGSGPAGTRATIRKFAGSTMANELSLFSSTSNAGEGVCAAVKFAPSRRTPSTAVRQIELRADFIECTVIFPSAWTNGSSKYYTLVARPFLFTLSLEGRSRSRRRAEASFSVHELLVISPYLPLGPPCHGSNWILLS